MRPTHQPMIRNPFRRKVVAPLEPQADSDPPQRAAQNEFRLVTLPEPARRCPICTEFAYLMGKSTRHDDWHNPRPGHDGGHLPQRWQVARELKGDPIAIGTNLRLVTARHQTFHEQSVSDTIEWLLEATDGPQAGEIFYVWTSADRDEEEAEPYGVAGSGIESHPPRHPLWPTGLEILQTTA